MQAVIIVIGDEILSGNTVDTNSAFITSKLRMAGFNTVRIFTVPDETETIVATLQTAWDLAEVIITTGGLGPTTIKPCLRSGRFLMITTGPTNQLCNTSRGC